ncbi:MAG: hypothetical protein JW724_07545 [Candidatus Altiarchaeota archaeon]|nr:hypothetical protein [Candidatus Altiarchaeota archaeon]
MSRHVIKPGYFLFFCIISYAVVVFGTYANPLFPGGVDAANHLFQTWFIREYGLADWNPYWYGGSPLLDQYPPLTHVFSALLAVFFGVVGGYKTAYALGFLALPVCFWLFLKEFDLGDYEKKFAIFFFSFSIIFVHYFQEGVYSALLSFNLVIMYFKFLKRFMDKGGFGNVLYGSVLLGLCALSHALNPVYALIFSVPFILALSKDGIKKLRWLVYVPALTFLMCAWFWIPYFTNYSSPGAGVPDYGLFTVFAELGRAFVVSANYVGMFFTGALLLFLVHLVAGNVNRKTDTRYTVFMISIALILFMMRFIPVLGLQETKRALFFMPMFLSIYVAKGIAGFRHRTTLSVVLLLPLLILFFSYPAVNVDVNEGISAVMDHISASDAQRVLFLPERFDLMTVNKSYYPVAEDTYASFLAPYMTGRSVLNGLWSVGALSVDKPNEYWGMTNLKCKYVKSYSDLISDASWVNKNTLGTRKTCEPKLDASRYCELARESSLDLIIVNKLFPEAVEYIECVGCTSRVREFDGFIVYEVLDKKPFITFSDAGTDYTYKRHPGDIWIDFNLEESGPANVNVTESYMKHWKACLDGEEIPVARTAYGYISCNFNEQAGTHTLSLAYEPERYGGFFTYLSIASWLLVLGSLIFLKQKNN